MASDIILEDGEIKVVDGDLIIEGRNGTDVVIDRDLGGVAAIKFQSGGQLLASWSGNKLSGVEMIQGAKSIITERLNADQIFASNRITSRSAFVDHLESGSGPSANEEGTAGKITVKDTAGEPSVSIEGADLNETLVGHPRMPVVVRGIQVISTGDNTGLESDSGDDGGLLPSGRLDESNRIFDPTAVGEVQEQLENLDVQLEIVPKEIDLIAEVLRLRRELRELKAMVESG